MKFYKSSLLSFTLLTLIISFALSAKVSAQDIKQIVRMAKIVIDSAPIDKYKAALK